MTSTSSMNKIETKQNGDKDSIIKSSTTSTKKITSSKIVTKTVVSNTSKGATRNVKQFKTSETSNIFSEKSWSSSLNDGKFGSTLQQEKTVSFETNSSESNDFTKGAFQFDEQHALHLRQGARPKTTATSLIHASGLNTKLDAAGFDLHPDLHIPSSIHPSPASLRMKEVWEEGFTLFPEYFPDVLSGQSLRERLQRSVNTEIPVKETKLLSSSTKQYSWEKLDGDEESEAQKIANSWLQIFGEEPKRKIDSEQKAIKNS